MANAFIEQANSGRSDLSRFMVHLTRDDRNDTEGWYEQGMSEHENFRNILKTKTIYAYKAHCLHRHRVARMSEDVQNAFKVACFSEMPLGEVEKIAKHMPGRRYQFRRYGFVFRREFLLESGAEQVTYINEYDARGSLRKAYDTLFNIGARSNFKGETWRMLPYVSTMREKCDFAWERGYRIVGGLSFGLEDLVCVILPRSSTPIGNYCTGLGIPIYVPGLSPDQQLLDWSQQQRRTSGASKWRSLFEADSK